jgi:chemotaxis protein CheD
LTRETDGMNATLHTDVLTGEVGFSLGKGVIVSAAIGSCVAVAMHGRAPRAGGLAHIMLPGSAPECNQHTAESLKYARNGIEYLLGKMIAAGVKKHEIIVFAAGGGNVLKRADDTICKSNITSVLELLAEHELVIKAKFLGGFERRSVRLDIASGNFFCAQGDFGEVMVAG